MHASVAVDGFGKQDGDTFQAPIILYGGEKPGYRFPASIYALTFLCFVTLNRTTTPSTLAAAAMDTDGFSLSASRAVERIGSEFSERVVILHVKRTETHRWQ